MTYDTVASISQSAALIFFMILFGCVVAYVFWPGNKRKFEHAAKLPFEDSDIGDTDAGRVQKRKS